MTVAIIDLQDRLVPAMAGADALILAARKLISGARLLGQEIRVTEQNPAKLGPTVADLDLVQAATFAKQSFDASGLLTADGAGGPFVIAGCEAHICVRQTVRGLLERGHPVVVAVDAIGSRKPRDLDVALRAMSAWGAELSTVEAILFDWLGSAEHAAFREISRLIK